MKSATLDTQMASHTADTADTTNAASTTNATLTPPRHWKLILALYLAGIGMGALDAAIVNPARTVIQEGLGVGDQVSVRVFTIYTLAYAAGIPAVGKLVDLWGIKPVSLVAIGLFAVGSLGCGLSQTFESYGMLLASRAVQTLDGGGIMPVATATVTTVAPPAKQGRALGLVGMVCGMTSMLGAGAGSLVLAVAGAGNWQWIFYISLPVIVVVIRLDAWVLPRGGARDTRRLGLVGIAVLAMMITALLWGFQHLDFGDFLGTARQPNVFLALTSCAVLVPVFWWCETRLQRRGGDPIINFKYFTTLPVLTTLLVGGITGTLMMTVMFIPQFSEFTLGLPRGTGGFPTVLVGLASAVGAPLSGRLTDKFGSRFVLGMGLVISAGSGVLLVFWATPFPGLASTLAASASMGPGTGFLVGAPLSYLVLHLVSAHDANSGQATLSLVRSIATTLTPALLVSFLTTGVTADGSDTSPSGTGWFSLFHEGLPLGFACMPGFCTLVSILGMGLLAALPSKSRLATHEPVEE